MGATRHEEGVFEWVKSSQSLLQSKLLWRLGGSLVVHPARDFDGGRSAHLESGGDYELRPFIETAATSRIYITAMPCVSGPWFRVVRNAGNSALLAYVAQHIHIGSKVGFTHDAKRGDAVALALFGDVEPSVHGIITV